MRRGDEYLPPLTKSILLLLGLDGARTTAHHVATHVARSSSLASAKPTTPRLGRLRSRAMSTGTGGAVCAAAAEQLRAQQPPPPQHTSLDLRSAPSDEGGGGFGHGAV
ncbi:hypothetical protein EMIHUDRAFT_258752 [Emiliania huxleyi CCMP1516]|uniref:Secreted protein n=2 Tax=Emiliania huxleyi TaxID=2903 RepID=A0A0D3I637_EMIH1|nr:hypothetical protein EMIHUDRAFT_258752 [Emiliania huxleyi CCMP1516]EOD06722.1 hypothetical protein EMIHUDRAFT_258752 [Emiliania huxleyi CCMP1516]|eukprot:XP_005759151.1 hypothetical protein EMIHUDRAFT_258752 [Emiliania huxleyi CCMP1516]